MWLIRLALQPRETAAGRAAGVAGGINLMDVPVPLPEPVSQDFACMPEYLLEEMVDFMTMLTRQAPQQLAAWAPRRLGEMLVRAHIL